MEAAIAELQKPFLDGTRIAASRAIMGLDTQLVEDGTYFFVEEDGDPAGCSIPHATRRASGPCTRIRVMPAESAA
jgi:hypothetical protein